MGRDERRLLDSVETGGALRSHVLHRRTLFLYRDRVRLRCLDCRLEFEGPIRDSVEAWNAHLPDEAAAA